MKKKNVLSIVICLLTLIFLSFSAFSKPKGPPLSQRRYKKILKIVKTFQKSGEDLRDSDVQAIILKEVDSLLPLQENNRADKRTTRELAKSVRDIVNKKFTKSAVQIRKEAESNAEKKFFLCKPMDKVSVKYQRGDKIYSAEGVFYSYGGNSVKIGNRTVAIFDLLPEYRVKFDEKFCESEKKKYVEKLIRDYHIAKNSYSLDTFREMKEKQITGNESAGFVYVWKEWHTPKEVAQIIMKTYTDKSYHPEEGTKVADKKSPLEEENKDKDVKVAETPDEEDKDKEEKKNKDKNKDKEEKKTEEESSDKALFYKKVLKQANKKLLKIANTHSGIDADQGYKKALWGMTKQEVNILLNFDPKAPRLQKIDENTEVIEYSAGPVEKVELKFLNNTFYRVIVNFRIDKNNSIMRKLVILLNERYGLTDEQKEARKKQKAEGGEADASEEVAEEENKDKPKDGEEPKIPLEQTYHWTGKITLGQIIIKANAERTQYVEFTLIKESPSLEKSIEQSLKERKAIEREKKRKKELEQFNKNKIVF